MQDWRRRERALRIWGTFKLFVGVLAMVSSLLGMMQGENRIPQGWWGPVTLASAVLLGLEGISELLAGAHSNLLIVLAGVVPIGIAGLFQEWSPRVWVFASMLAFFEWTIRRLSKTTERSEVGTLLFSVVLGAALANTTGELFRFYWDAPSVWTLSQIARFMFPIMLPWILVVVLIAHSGREVLRPGVGIADANPSGQ
jgi:hypothetical protein